MLGEAVKAVIDDEIVPLHAEMSEIESFEKLGFKCYLAGLTVLL